MGQEASKEPSAVGGFINSVKEATDERPWLWILIVGGAVLPFILIYFFCFGGKDDKDALRKKTDEPTPDDAEDESDADEGAKEESGEGSDDNKEKEKEDGEEEEQEVVQETDKKEDEVTEEKSVPEDLKS